MHFLEQFSKSLSDLTGISSTPILLTVYSIILIIVVCLMAKGLIFLNTHLNPNERSLFLFNKKVRIFKIVIIFVFLFLIWEKQIGSIITLSLDCSSNCCTVLLLL